MNTLRKFKGILALTLIGVFSATFFQAHAETKAITGSTTSTILWDPEPNGKAWVAYNIEAISDKYSSSGLGGRVIVQARDSSVPKYRMTVASASTSSNLIFQENTGLAVGDTVYAVPKGVSGLGFVATVSVLPAGGTNAFVSANITTNLAVGDYVYKLTPVWSTGVGSNAVSRVSAGGLFETYGDSPVRIVLDSLVTNSLSVNLQPK
jgi:hypothetical protein